MNSMSVVLSKKISSSTVTLLPMLHFARKHVPVKFRQKLHGSPRTQELQLFFLSTFEAFPFSVDEQNQRWYIGQRIRCREIYSFFCQGHTSRSRSFRTFHQVSLASPVIIEIESCNWSARQPIKIYHVSRSSRSKLAMTLK